MSIPTNMKTGISIGYTQENMYPETFFIIYHVLGAILRRCGFKDCITYCQHNNLDFDQEVFNSGILFNLFSEYGVGKSLEPLIHELFFSINLDYETNKDNIFFQEIIKLTPEVSRVIRSHDTDCEANWLLNYSTGMVDLVDDISLERDFRLSSLLTSHEKGCKFCEEFKKYHNLDENRNITEIITNVLTNIAQNINRMKIFN